LEDEISFWDGPLLGGVFRFQWCIIAYYPGSQITLVVDWMLGLDGSTPETKDKQVPGLDNNIL